MQINKQLNLVISLERDGGETIYVHAEPVRYEIFKKFYLVFSKTFAALGQQGLGAVAGPRVAMMMLEEIAQNTARTPITDWWEGDDGVERGLLPEMRRLTNVLLPDEDGGGWSTQMLDVALKRGLLDEEEVGDVMNQLAFFTVGWRAAPRQERELLVKMGARLYTGLTTSLNSTEYATSLRTSTRPESTGENDQPSSLTPSPTPPAPAGPPGRGRRTAAT